MPEPQRVLSEYLTWVEVVLEKTLESPLDCKIQPVHPKGDQSWVFIGSTDVMWMWLVIEARSDALKTNIA